MVSCFKNHQSPFSVKYRYSLVIRDQYRSLFSVKSWYVDTETCLALVSSLVIRDSGMSVYVLRRRWRAELPPFDIWIMSWSSSTIWKCFLKYLPIPNFFIHYHQFFNWNEIRKVNSIGSFLTMMNEWMNSTPNSRSKTRYNMYFYSKPWESRKRACFADLGNTI